MDILYLLIPLSIVLVFMIGLFLWWSVRNNQFDDLDGPAYRILMDDDRSPDMAESYGRDVDPDQSSDRKA
ncbi:MAG: cbb3-type cytochrome oxidase assembly protein CcoS [Candidatus Nitricoxidivorans perseverans]|uniref:Cbb3-type cytochrome oxidase assembly protein CcoS n=1 Tax=Candidatus Nitricoxidivorans perseverans TaxID=2975601 RepID=A0AA49IXZ5_9PROT|nr:MAG: cbb3-type cytochrome oxidase assembly protein CcoS [Candidatus Nitricoxidivorans perseverans]